MRFISFKFHLLWLSPLWQMPSNPPQLSQLLTKHQFYTKDYFKYCTCQNDTNLWISSVHTDSHAWYRGNLIGASIYTLVIYSAIKFLGINFFVQSQGGPVNWTWLIRCYKAVHLVVLDWSAVKELSNSSCFDYFAQKFVTGLSNKWRVTSEIKYKEPCLNQIKCISHSLYECIFLLSCRSNLTYSHPHRQQWCNSLWWV